MTSELSCSVIIPCFNEVDNIQRCVEEIPTMGRWTEIIVVDDGSSDGTAKKVTQIQEDYKNVKLISYSENKGKAHAVKEGFDQAKGDVLIILDADMTVPPKELPPFFEVISSRMGSIVNGTRMVYPMERGAMGKLRFLGNKFFSLVFTCLTGQRITDTLCGTKAILRSDCPKIEMGRSPWGDFDILIGASKLGLKILEVPVHYRKRSAGKSKMRIFHDGILLIWFCLSVLIKLEITRIPQRAARICRLFGTRPSR